MTLNEKYLAKFDDIKSMYGLDTEVFHVKADGLLCELLTELGFGDVVEKFSNEELWYA